MEGRFSQERKVDTWGASPMSPLSLSSCDSFGPQGSLRLDIGEIEAEPFSRKFIDMFGGLGLQVGKDDNNTSEDDMDGSPESQNSERFRDNRDAASDWNNPGIEELVILSAKRRRSGVLPTIHEDNQESRCSISVPTASLSDFEFEFDAFDHPSANGTTICLRRDDQTKYTIKRKRAPRNSIWTEQSILETLTTQELPFFSRLFWSFHSGEHIYIVTENHTGGDLEGLIHDQGPFNIYHATFYTAELVSAIASLHAAGIMHRDLEPRNIRLDAQGHIILTNFGRAQFVRDSVPGTQRANPVHHCVPSIYRAPEILLGWSHDHAVDCWSFGMLLYYMVFGTSPYGNAEGKQDDRDWVYGQVVRSAIPTESLRLVHPMARDLILKCLERNPQLRWDTAKIKSHPFFESIDWNHVSCLKSAVPFFEQPPAKSPKAVSTPVSNGHHRHSSLNSSILDKDRQPTVKVAPNVHRRTQSIPRPSAPEPTGDDTPMSPISLFKSLGQVMSVVHEDEHPVASPVLTSSEHPVSVSGERQAFEENYEQRVSKFWDELDKDEAGSAASINSQEFGAATGIPYNKAPKLRKYRSALQAHSRLFSVSTSSFQRIRKKQPRSTGTLREKKVVPVLEDLPLGVHQMGSGIGFNYTVPAAAPSKVSIGSFTPSCHLFQRGFSVRNLGLALGNSSTPKMKAKPFNNSPPLSQTRLEQLASPTETPQQLRQEVGNGTFIREMSRSPSWILSPTECLPSPMALVNVDVDSPLSTASGSELLSPVTLVNPAEEIHEDDEDCHVNITIPKNLELELDCPLANWAPDSTLRLVPQIASSDRLPCNESESSSFYMESSWA